MASARTAARMQLGLSCTLPDRSSRNIDEKPVRASISRSNSVIRTRGSSASIARSSERASSGALALTGVTDNSSPFNVTPTRSPLANRLENAASR